MKQHYAKIILFCLCCLIGAKASAQEFEVDGIYYNFNEDGTSVSVTYKGNYSYSYENEYMGHVTIPKIVTYSGNNYSVTSISYYAFSGCSGLTSVTIPNSVTSIGSSAFYGCSGLTSVTIPNSVTSIGEGAFRGCSGLTSVTIPNSVTSIGYQAFYGCSGLTSVTIPNSVTRIDWNAFSGCSGLTSVTIPNSVTSIDYYAFEGCSGLTSVTIPNSVTSIDNGAFFGCSGLTSVTIPNNVTSIGDGAFSGCSGLTSMKVDEGNKTYDSRDNCNAIIETKTNELIMGCKNTVFPNSVTSIGSSAFRGCSGLTSVTIPNSVTSIDHYAFSGCSGLTSVTIPNSVTSIGDYAFYGCSGLTSVTIPNSVTSIGSYAFDGCSGLTSVTIPNSVTTIGDWAFEGCRLLILCNNPTPPNAANNSFTDNSVAIVPQEAANKYKEAEGWKNLKINCAAFSISNITQTTISLATTDVLSDQYVSLEGEKNTRFYPKDGMLKITGLLPDKEYKLNTHGMYNGISLDTIYTVKTRPVTLALKKVDATNTTISIKGICNNGDAIIKECGFEGFGIGDELIIDGLAPGKKMDITYYIICSDGSKLTKKETFSTIPVTVRAKAIPTTSSCQLIGTYDVIDATVVDYGFKGQSKHTELKITGLDPNTEYSNQFYVTTKEGGKVYTNIAFSTKKLSMTTQQPKVISVGNVIVAAEANLDEEETNAGFEWRRTDWNDDFASNTGGAYIYEGTMEGYIRNLNTEKLWKFRPYYESNSGKRYYGEWVGLDPTNTSYFEPTVHTYAKIDVQNNTASVKGYAMRGSDNVASQGFKYWKSAAGARAQGGSKVSVPADAKTVEASGQVMTAELTGLDYESSYSYVAFMTTTEGQTFYGEVQSFQTGVDTSGIDSPTTAEEAYEVARYDVKGRRISTPQRGLNILRLSDGSVRKVMVK